MCSVLMVRVVEMRSVEHVFDELAEQSGTDGMAESPRGQSKSERRIFSLRCGCGGSKSESEVSGKLSCSAQIDGKYGSKWVHSIRRALQESRYE